MYTLCWLCEIAFVVTILVLPVLHVAVTIRMGCVCNHDHGWLRGGLAHHKSWKINRHCCYDFRNLLHGHAFDHCGWFVLFLADAELLILGLVPL